MIVTQLTQAKKILSDWRSENNTIALVPTMGNLHAGHLSLIQLAQNNAQRVVVTIFVNPLQFNQADDLNNYPRTEDADLKALEAIDVDLVVIPTESEIYPNGLELAARIELPKISEEFCGQFRPGHFAGVCSVITKLFNALQPNIAVFGQKDYQQLQIIKRLTAELLLDIEIISGITMREDNGLALSSRNQNLNQDQQQIAASIYRELQKIAKNYSAQDLELLTQSAKTTLERQGLRVEYLAARDSEDLTAVTQSTENIVVLAAAWLESTRLIDNILFPKP